MLDHFVAGGQSATMPVSQHPGIGQFPDPVLQAPALSTGLHIHNVGDWVVPATGK